MADNHTTTWVSCGSATAVESAEDHEVRDGWEYGMVGPCDVVLVECETNDDETYETYVTISKGLLWPAPPRGFKRAALEAARAWNGGLDEHGECHHPDIPQCCTVAVESNGNIYWQCRHARTGQIVRRDGFESLDEACRSVFQNAPDPFGEWGADDGASADLENVR